MIETRQARYFVAVADELHFGRAAEVLQMSQPPLSQAIRALERQLRVRLLDRTSRHVALTEAGAAFLKECRVLLADADRAERAAARAHYGATGTLRVGAVTSAFDAPLPAILNRFRTRPHVHLQMSEIDTHDGAAAVLSGELDAALIRQVATNSRLRSTPLRRDHLVAALPNSHPHAISGGDRTDPTARLVGSEPDESEPLDLAELAGDDWVWLPRRVSPDYHDELVAACRRYGFSPRSTHTATSISSQLSIVGCGLGVALVPHTAARPHHVTVSYREPTQRLELVELSLVWRADNTEPLLRHFLFSVSGSPATGH